MPPGVGASRAGGGAVPRVSGSWRRNGRTSEAIDPGIPAGARRRGRSQRRNGPADSGWGLLALCLQPCHSPAREDATVALGRPPSPFLSDARSEVAARREGGPPSADGGPGTAGGCCGLLGASLWGPCLLSHKGSAGLCDPSAAEKVAALLASPAPAGAPSSRGPRRLILYYVILHLHDIIYYSIVIIQYISL